MLTPLFVTPKDLEEWAERIDAAPGLPKLIRLLVHATTTTLRRCDFPSDEGVRSKGFDGIVESLEGTAWVPAGRSYWEVSTERNPKAKAGKDYRARTKRPAAPGQAGSHYLAVTLRAWSGRRQWADTRDAEGLWSSVRAYDANDLSAWLEQAPAVSAWFGRLRGLRLPGVSDLEDYWEELAYDGPDPIVPELVRGSGSQREEKLVQVLFGPPKALRIEAETSRDAGLWFTAVIRSMEEAQRNRLLARTLVVREPESWRALIRTVRPLILVPAFDDIFMVGAAVKWGHHVVLVRAEGKDTDGPLTEFDALQVPTPLPEEVVTALVASGISEAVAIDMAQRRGTPPRRVPEPAVAPAPGEPDIVWPEPTLARRLAPLVLAGQWDDESAEDRAGIGRLTARRYDEVLDDVMVTLRDVRGPLERSGSVFRWKNRRDAWSTLSGLLGRADLDRFFGLFTEVFAVRDPALDLPPDERWMAAALGKAHPWSAGLRKGLVDALALLSTAGSQVQDRHAPKYRVARAVGELLDAASVDRWLSLADSLPVMAEAAPERFLEAVRHGLLSDAANAAALFTEEGPWGGARHTNLLWALERLAWPSTYFGGACLALAELATVDPGGRVANRPFASLLEVFRSWHPQTMAPLEQRLSQLDGLHQHFPDIAGRLAMDLLPQRGGESALGSSRPEWQPWSDGWTEPSDEEVERFIGGVSERLLLWAGRSASWARVIERLDRMPPAARAKALSFLDSAEAHDLSDAVEVWHSLRRAVNSYLSFPDAEWALDPHEVEVLQRAWVRLSPPAQSLDLNAWLFQSNVELPLAEDDDYDGLQRTISIVRALALRAVFDAQGLAGVRQLATYVEIPYYVGIALADAFLEEEIDASTRAEILGSDSVALQLVAKGFTARRFAQGGWTWADRMVARVEGTQKAELLTYLPFNSDTWDRAEVAGLSEDYWFRVSPSSLRNAEADAPRAVRALLDADRPWSALETALTVLGGRRGMGDAIPSELIAEALDTAAGRSPSDESNQPLRAAAGSTIARLISVLEERADLENARLAQIEWQWLPAVRFDDANTKALQRAVVTEPELFVSVLSFVYRDERTARGEEPEPDERAQALAQHGWHLLQLLGGLPGRGAGGVDASVLNAWVLGARERARACGRGTIADHEIGKLLGRASPPGVDGVWPHEAVRDILEAVDTPSLLRGFTLGPRSLTRTRAVGGRNPGDPDRATAERYREWAKSVDGRWPVTAGALRSLADSFEALASDLEQRFHDE